MKILYMMAILGLGTYVGGVFGMCIWSPSPWFILTTFAGIGLLAVAGISIIEKTHRAEMKRIDKKFYEEWQKINKG